MSDAAEEAGRRLVDALHSQDAQRVAAAIRELDARWPRLQDVPLPAPAANVLDTLDRSTSEEVAVAYVTALLMYDFTPPVDCRDRLQWTMEALLRHGGSRLAADVFLKLADPASFGSGPAEALAMAEELGVPDESAKMALSWLVSFLIGHPDTRRPTLDAIIGWTQRPVFDEVARFVMPQLSSDERARFVDEQPLDS